MSATELIKQVASLSEQERARFEQLFRAMENHNRVSGPTSHPHWPDFGERLRGIYGDRVVPDSQNIIDEGRGEH